MSDLSELLDVAKNIEKQNAEIIRLLKKIAGEDSEKKNPIMDFGELYISKDVEEIPKKEPREIENTFKIGSLLENSIGVGEVYFIENMDIFKLSIKDNETIVDNLTGDGDASNFNLQEMIANESIKNNDSLEDSTVILSMEQSQNLPEVLKICVEQGASKIYMPLFASAQLVGAPQVLMDLVKMDFYKSEEHLLEKLF